MTSAEAQNTGTVPVRALRKQRKLTIDAFAQELGTSRQTVVRWEKGRGPDREWAEKIAAAFGGDPRAYMRTRRRASAIDERLAALEDVLEEMRADERDFRERVEKRLVRLERSRGRGKGAHLAVVDSPEGP